jgi:hypothetical protein
MSGLLFERIDRFIRFALVLALGLFAFLCLRSAIIAAERARALETELTDLQSEHARLRADALSCYDELTYYKRRVQRR